MRSIGITLAVCAITFIATAAVCQLPYTSANAVPWNLTRNYELSQNLDLQGNVVPITTSGTDVIWDLSFVELEGPIPLTAHFRPASETPFHSNFPSANVAVWEPYLSGNSDYTYFNNSPFELRLLGGVHVENDDPQVQTFCPDPFLIMDYPMTYGSGVQQVHDCDTGQVAIDNWVIMATGTVVYDGGSIGDLVLWRSIYSINGTDYISYFWTTYDNVLYPVVRYLPGEYLQVWNTVSEEVGIHDAPTWDPGLQLFPNPATDRLNLALERTSGIQMNVQLLDIAGRRVRELGTIPAASGSASFIVGDLSAGTYVIELRDDAGTIMSRRPFVKD